MILKHSLSLVVLASAIVAGQVHADIIFSENVGTGTGTLSYAANTWQTSLTFTGTGDTRSTSPSSGYSGASGNRNVFLTASATPRTLLISGINTIGFIPGTFDLSFGAHKSTTSSDMTELTLEYSGDGVNFNSIAIPAQPTGGGTANWRLLSFTGLSLPNVSNLTLRWTNTASSGPQFRLDDIVLQATAVPEPSGLALLLGLAGMVVVRRRRT